MLAKVMHVSHILMATTAIAGGRTREMTVTADGDVTELVDEVSAGGERGEQVLVPGGQDILNFEQEEQHFQAQLASSKSKSNGSYQREVGHQAGGVAHQAGTKENSKNIPVGSFIQKGSTQRPTVRGTVEAWEVDASGAVAPEGDLSLRYGL
ncbi:unnamed protein product [Amoebophrya sp. A25]|nr:unnamed protein product [Amoebophrya sp. A25]|eukprot:GSA25T00017268001.1